jgi:DNA-binding CsgD family transcriptional regulator
MAMFAANLAGMLQRIAGSPDMTALEERLAEAIAPLGMSASAGGMLTGPRADTIYFMTWDLQWARLYQARNYRTIDPVIRYAIVSGEAGSWSEIYAGFPQRDPGHAVLREARRFGYLEGFATPVRMRDGSLGLVSIGGAQRSFTAEERAILEAVSTATLRRAESFFGDPAPAEPIQPLSPRERETVELLRQGLTDAEMAQAMCVGVTTVRTYVEAARRKLQARNRTHLASLPVR